MQSIRERISEFVKCAYLAYFKVMLGDQNKAWAPHIVCVTNKEICLVRIVFAYAYSVVFFVRSATD